MKYFILLLFIPTICLPQSFDEVHTVEDVESYIKKNFKYYKRKYDKFTMHSFSKPNYDNFKVGDYNHDGNRDLLVYGEAEVSKGKETYTKNEIIIFIGENRRAEKVKFPYTYFRYLLRYHVPEPKVIRINEKDFIQINYDYIDREKNAIETFRDTVFIENLHVVPYAKNPSMKKISKIHFKTDYCYGSCPVFELWIDRNGEVEYNGIDHVSKRGRMRLSIGKEDWKYIEKLVNHLEINKLSDYYGVNWTDDQTGFLTITFTDGKKIQIEDYGMKGTFGLSILYEFLFELKNF